GTNWDQNLSVSRCHRRRDRRGCQQVSEARRKLAAVLGDHVCVSHRHSRIGVTEAILSRRHRHAFTVHDSFVSVTESMKAATLDPELLQQGIELPLPNDIRIPRRTVASCKEQTQAVRSPGAKISAKMFHELRGNFADTIALFRLHVLDLPMPNLLSDFDRSGIEQKIRSRESARLAASDPRLGENPVVGFFRLRRGIDYELHLVEREARLVDEIRIRENETHERVDRSVAVDFRLDPHLPEKSGQVSYGLRGESLGFARDERLQDC